MSPAAQAPVRSSPRLQAPSMSDKPHNAHSDISLTDLSESDHGSPNHPKSSKQVDLLSDISSEEGEDADDTNFRASYNTQRAASGMSSRPAKKRRAAAMAALNLTDLSSILKRPTTAQTTRSTRSTRSSMLDGDLPNGSNDSLNHSSSTSSSRPSPPPSHHRSGRPIRGVKTAEEILESLRLQVDPWDLVPGLEEREVQADLEIFRKLAPARQQAPTPPHKHKHHRSTPHRHRSSPRQAILVTRQAYRQVSPLS